MKSETKYELRFWVLGDTKYEDIATYLTLSGARDEGEAYVKHGKDRHYVITKITREEIERK